MRLSKNEIFKFLENKLGNNCYIGLHGISDDPDIKNELSGKSKYEIVQNILDNGLLNNRQISIKSTCHIFGRLSDTYERNKYSIIDFNNLNVYKTELEHFVVVVAVPVIFSHSDGRRIFGGWMNPKIPYNDDKSPFECITDFLFKTGIPKEIILGYYHFNSDEKDVEFEFNDQYYYNLQQQDKDKFINDYFDSKGLVVDLNDVNTLKRIKEEKEKYLKEMLGIDYYNSPILVKNIDLQIEQYLAINEKNLELDNYSNIKDKENLPFYSFEEVQSIPIDLLDIDRIKIDFETLVFSKYRLRDIMINKKYNDTNLAKITGYYYYNQVDEKEYIEIEDFEQWIEKCGNTIENVYSLYYQMYYKELTLDFKKKLNNLKSDYMKVK